MKISAVIYVQYTTLINFENFKKSSTNFVILFVKNLVLKADVCGSRDMFVLVNRLKMFFRGIFIMSRSHQVNLTGNDIFKRQISKIAIFLKKNMLKKFPSRENSNIRCFFSKPEGAI